MWISAEFKVYLIKEIKRLKADENDRLKLEWSFQRTLAKVNYQIHTDAVKEKLIPETLSKAQIAMVYASEADLLNMALFGKTAKQWCEANPEKERNILSDLGELKFLKSGLEETLNSIKSRK